MGTEVEVLLEHHLGAAELDGLPDALNSYFMAHPDQGLFRGALELNGDLVPQADGRWAWQEDEKPYLPLGVQVARDETHWAWCGERDGPIGGPLLRGPNGHRLIIGRGAAVLDPIIRWRGLFEPTLWGDLRRYVRFLGRFLGSGSAVYYPDDIDPGADVSDLVLGEGWGYGQVVSWLGGQCAPATKVQDLVETFRHMCWQARGYYLDDLTLPPGEGPGDQAAPGAV